jgi:hypothetical protein
MGGLIKLPKWAKKCYCLKWCFILRGNTDSSRPAQGRIIQGSLGNWVPRNKANQREQKEEVKGRKKGRSTTSSFQMLGHLPGPDDATM